MSARLINAKKVAKNLRRHGKTVQDMTDTALRSGASLIENEAKENVPVLTGNLKRSIHSEPGDEQGRRIIRIGVDSGDAGYAPAVEARKPYLRPAFEAKKDEAIKEVEDALDDLIKEWNK